jgi:hypothetical protein
MPPDKKKNPDEQKEQQPQQPLPSTGQGSDSALDVLKKKRGQVPPSDPTLPLTPPKPKP